MNEGLYEIAGLFDLQGEIAEIRPLGEGFINDTYIVRTKGKAPDYILQRKNHLIFPDVPGMMDNIKAVTEHIKKKVKNPLTIGRKGWKLLGCMPFHLWYHITGQGRYSRASISGRSRSRKIPGIAQ